MSSLVGLFLAFVAVLAVGAPYLAQPIADSLTGPDPCRAATSIGPPDTACAEAHPDYYTYDPAAGLMTTRAAQIIDIVGAVSWPAAGLGALAAAIISGLALAASTRRRRLAIAALIISSLVVAWMMLVIVGLALGGGD